LVPRMFRSITSRNSGDGMKRDISPIKSFRNSCICRTWLVD